MKPVRIRTPGALFRAIVIEGTPGSCGGVVAGICAATEDTDGNTNRGGFVMSWEDFEEAYFALKVERRTAWFEKDAKWQRKEFADTESESK